MAEWGGKSGVIQRRNVTELHKKESGTDSCYACVNPDTKDTCSTFPYSMCVKCLDWAHMERKEVGQRVPRAEEKVKGLLMLLLDDKVQKLDSV